MHKALSTGHFFTRTLATAALALLPLAASAAQFTNGSLTGSVSGYSLVPAGWVNYNQGTSDTVSTAGHPFAGIFGGIGAYPYAASSDGGTFVWSAAYNGAPVSNVPEGIVQTVTGLTPGVQYAINFEYTNLSLYDSPTHIASNAFGVGYNMDSTGGWLVLGNGNALGSTPTVAPVSVAGTQQWSNFQLMFTAVAASETFSFVADYRGGPGNYVGMGIDGINLSAVPELPASAGLLMGLLVLGARQRPRLQGLPG